jgi:hypothetical protein
VVIAKLEHEVTWFKAESERIRNHNVNMRHDLASMTKRRRVLLDQKAFLSGELKALFKHNRVMEV